VHIKMCIDAASDLCCQVRVFSLCNGSGRHRPAGTADKTTTGLIDRLPVGHSARPVGVGASTRVRPTDQSQGSPATRTPARTFESHPTRTLTNEILVAR
jgi:hypothetical protein